MIFFVFFLFNEFVVLLYNNYFGLWFNVWVIEICCFFLLESWVGYVFVLWVILINVNKCLIFLGCFFFKSFKGNVILL